MAVINSIRVLMATTSCVGADLFDTEFYPGYHCSIIANQYCTAKLTMAYSFLSTA